MKKTELKEIIREEVKNSLKENKKSQMDVFLKEGKRKLEILKQNMRKEGYDV
jgi:predicted membrane GTPase involved in stress response